MHVVVLAYGPAQATKRAVRRAGILAGKGGEVFVVPATALAARGMSDLGQVRTVDDPGRMGLHEALLAIPEEPTLLLHDDIVITRKGIAAMERSLHCGNRYVVPYGNDRDLGNFVSSLPVDHAAERKLDRVSPPADTKEIVAIRVNCLMALKSDLVGLLEQPIVDPFFTVVSHDHNFFAAAGAIASHAGKCVKRTTPVDMAGRPLLVAALIVKDEEEMLPGCLDSLAPLVDRIEVCDTGSTDSTIEIAEAAGAHVTRREWPDDFGVARNYALEQCRDAVYVIVLDADERLKYDNPEQIRRYLATYSAEHPGLALDVANVDEHGLERNRFRSVRVFHGEGVEYRGKLHELPHAIGDPETLSGRFFAQLSIEHHGYTNEIVASKNKAGRNLALAEDAYETDPTPGTALHLARSLTYAGLDPDRARTLLEEAWEGSTEATKTAQAQILSLLADQYIALEDSERAFDLSARALRLVPADDTAAALVAISADSLGKHSDLIEIAEELVDAPSDPPAHYVEEHRTTYRNGVVRAYAATGRAEQAVVAAFDLLDDHPDGFESWEAMVACLNDAYGPAAIELLVPLSLKATAATFMEPLIRTYPSRTLAEFSAAYVAADGAMLDVVRTGLLAAAMADHDEAFELLLGGAEDLPPEIRVGLSDRIAGCGRADLADKLRSHPTAVAV